MDVGSTVDVGKCHLLTRLLAVETGLDRGT